MVNITLSIPDELQARLNQFPNINRSALFQRAAERELEIRTKISELKIPEEKLEKILAKSLGLSSSISFEIGSEIFLDWITENQNIKHLFPVAEIHDDRHVFDNVYTYLEDINAIQKLAEEKGVTLDKDQFARGFIITAKELTKILK